MQFLAALLSTLVAALTAAETASYSYSIPIDLSVISENLATATDSRLKQLVSEFEQAKGTSALISLASFYGSDFLEGTLTDVASLAQNIATASGAADASNSIITASSLSAPSPLAVVAPADTAAGNSTTLAATTAMSQGLASFGSLLTSALSLSGSNKVSSTTSKGGADTAVAAYGLPIIVGGGLLALL